MEALIERIKKAVENKKYNLLNSIDLDNALQYAIKNNNLDLVKFLVNKANADIHANNNQVLKWLILNSHLYVIEIEIRAVYNISYWIKWKVNETNINLHDHEDYVLKYVSKRGYLDIVKFLVNETNFYIWNKEVIQIIIENDNTDKNIIKYLKYLPIKILYMRINICRKIQNWFRRCIIKKYRPNSNYVKNDIKSRFESMQI